MIVLRSRNRTSRRHVCECDNKNKNMSRPVFYVWQGTRMLSHFIIFEKSHPERPLSRRLPHFTRFLFFGWCRAREKVRWTGPKKGSTLQDLVALDMCELVVSVNPRSWTRHDFDMDISIAIAGKWGIGVMVPKRRKLSMPPLRVPPFPRSSSMPCYTIPCKWDLIAWARARVIKPI